VLDKAEYLAFESTLNSAIVSYRFIMRHCTQSRVTIPHLLMHVMKQNLYKKMIFFNSMHCSKSRYVKRAIDVVPVKFGPMLPLFQMKVRHSTDGFSVAHLHINHRRHQHL